MQATGLLWLVYLFIYLFLTVDDGNGGGDDDGGEGNRADDNDRVVAVNSYKFKDGHTLLYSLPIIANHSLPIDLALLNHRILWGSLCTSL